MSGVLGLLVAARLRSVENFAGIINVVLFPLLFLSGALYPTEGMPAAASRGGAGQSGDLRGGPRAATRSASPQRRPRRWRPARCLGLTALAFVLTALLFDPEQRFFPTRPRAQDGS